MKVRQMFQASVKGEKPIISRWKEVTWMNKPVKMADIAARLDVSVVTVSKALSGQKGVSEELRQKIKKMAQEMGYTPIHTAPREQRKSYTIGVITLERYFSKFASFYWKMYQELTTKAVTMNCLTMLEVVGTDFEKALVAPKMLDENRVDGIIVLGKPEQEYLNKLYSRRKVPMVLMDFYDYKGGCDSVVSSNYYGGYLLTQYLLDRGHRDIAYVGTLLYTESITDRYYGYCKALMESNIQVREDWIITDRDEITGIIGLEHEFQLPKDMPTGFVCNNDVTAYALIETLRRNGYRVPEDVSVVGYDNYLYPEYGDSHITTYEVNMAKMSKTSLKCLIKKIESNVTEVNNHIVSGRMIIRDTVAERK